MPDSTIFIVDDDVYAAASLQALLQAFDFTSTVFHSAESFLETYDGHTNGFLILDIRLRGMSGLELLKRLAANGSPLNVVIVSGHADTYDRHQALEYGAVTILDKPFPAEKLYEVLRETSC